MEGNMLSTCSMLLTRSSGCMGFSWVLSVCKLFEACVWVNGSPTRNWCSVALQAKN